MSDSASANLYVGARLSVKEALNLFGEKRENSYRPACPKDKTPRTKGADFCSKCGHSYKTTRVVKEGIKNIEDLDSYRPFQSANLETLLIDWRENKIGVIIGKKVGSGYSDGSDKVTHVNADIPRVIETVKKALTNVGVTIPPKLYLITRYCY